MNNISLKNIKKIKTIDNVTYYLRKNNVFAGAANQSIVEAEILPTITFDDGKSYPVTNIIEFGFCYCRLLKSVIIPDSIYTIQQYAFKGCEKLKDIKLSNSLVSIKIGAFCDCVSLESVELHNSVKILEEIMFSGCKNLKNVILPSSLKIIMKTAFYGCQSIEHILLPDTLEVIEECAFQWCSGLKSIEIPDSVTWIGESAFCHCSKLERVKFPKNISVLWENMFFGCKKLRHVNLIELLNLEKIESGVFLDCYSLTTIAIPENVKTISERLLGYDAELNGKSNIEKVVFSKVLVNRPDADAVFRQLFNAGLRTREILLRIPTL